MRKVFLRSPYNYDADEASVQSGLVCEDESLTLQSQAIDADINVIVKRYGVTGQLPQGWSIPTYQDFEGIFDYRTAMDAIRDAEHSFMSVPASIRARFDNDPQQFVAFCSDSGNVEELRKMGLAVPEVKMEVEDGKRKVAGAKADSAVAADKVVA